MAIQVVELTDTFDQWRVKDNLTASNFGDLSTLTTTDKTSLCAAINEIFTNDSDDMENLVDDLTPQLGGSLDLNGSSITGTGHIGIVGTLTVTNITGTVTGITQSANNNSTLLATTAYVDASGLATTMSGLANLDVLQYNSSTTKWENKTMSSAGIPTSGFAVAMAIALG